LRGLLGEFEVGSFSVLVHIGLREREKNDERRRRSFVFFQFPVTLQSSLNKQTSFPLQFLYMHATNLMASDRNRSRLHAWEISV